MSNKKYWKGFDELENSPEFVKNSRNEFSETPPVLEELKSTASTHSGRRDFLKILGYSVTAATVAASCEIPVRRVMPYVVKPEEITPGLANYYASTFVNGSDYCSVLVKTREGRPIKIEGNELSTITKGGTSARAQASVISLYDNARLKKPAINGADSDWPTIDKEIKSKLASVNGDIVILSNSIVSPSTKAAINKFKNRFGKTKVVFYEPVSKSGMLYANEASFGKKVVPGYNFEKAEVIVSVDCDFLGTWVSPTEFSADYIKNRKISPDNPTMSQHFQFESRVTTTGASADYRRSIKPSQVGAVLVELLREVGGSAGSSGAQFSEIVTNTIKKAALALKGARGKSLIVSGSNDPDVQMIVNAINSQLNNYGTTIDFDSAYTAHQGDDKAMVQLVADMKAGRVGALLLNNVNPSYSYPDAAAFNDGLAKVGLSISFNDRVDETAAAGVKYLTPDHHYLESWSDAEFRTGHYSLIQPTISPLFDTRSMGESLLSWSGAGDVDFYDFIRKTWKSNLIGGASFNDAWNKALHDGVYVGRGGSGEIEESGMAGATFTGSTSSAVSKIASKAQGGGGIEVTLYENITIGDGRYANNPFLQETPDPIAKVCWDNYAIVSPKTADKNGWTDGSLMRTPTKGSDIISVTSNGKTIELPITIQPGMQEDVIAIAVGYGRKKPGSEHCTVGANAYPLLAYNGNSFDFDISNASMSKTSNGYELAQTQTHHTIDDKREIINETTLAEYKVKNDSGNYSGQRMADPVWKDHHHFTLYGNHDYKLKQGHHWGLAVDLNSCTGCSACVVACNIENNVPIVGKENVHRAHEMHWMRIDRYYSANPEKDPDFEHPEIAFQPMMCQHCDNAPCENVCPVNASNHSSEGLNQMAYNRCIGTRYCANNCPFKVRRFNWFDFTGTDSFYAKTMLDNDQTVMVDNLSRMVLNPDVTIRSRGVMEKCSFCVQKIQDGKLEAKKGKRKLRDGEIKTACQSSCPTHAITFGDMNDKDSEVNEWRENRRNYELLLDIHVLSSVSYLTKVRNKEEIEGKVYNLEHTPMEDHGGHGDHGDGHGGDHGGHGAHGDGHGGDHGKGGHGKDHGAKGHGKDHGKDHGKGHGDHGHDHGDHGHDDHKH